MNDDIPRADDTWLRVRLGDVATLVSGGTPSKSRPDWWAGTIPWASPKDLKVPRLWDTEDHVSDEAAHEGSRIVPAGTLFVVIRGMILAKDIPVALAMRPMAFNQDLKAILPGERIDPEFLLFALQAGKDRRHRLLGSSAHGTKSIVTSAVADILVPLPPLAEQRAIARALRAVQAATDARRRELDLERERKATLLASLLDPTDEQTGWRSVRLGDVVRTASGGTPDRGEASYWGGDIPWVRTGEIKYNTIKTAGEHITAAGLANSSARVFPAGTLIMAMFGQGVTRGRVAMLGLDAAINQACCALIPTEPIHVSYLFHLLTARYEQLRTLGHGANQKNLNAALIRSVELDLPGAEYQQQAATALTACDLKVATGQDECNLLDELFGALLEDLMSGRLSSVPLIEVASDGETPT